MDIMETQHNDINRGRGKNRWLKFIAVCLGIIALAIILYLVLLQPAIDENNRLIDRRIEELEQKKINIK